MRRLFSRQAEPYTGAQLRSGWLEERFGLGRDAVASFPGPCDVLPEFMVDLEDLEAGEKIRAAMMLHFIAEHPDPDIGRAVLRQRLLVESARSVLVEEWGVRDLRREGDDIILVGTGNRRKLSVSVATVSPGSALTHLGINIDPAGAPVPAVGLEALGVPVEPFAEAVMARYDFELGDAEKAAGKVKTVP